MTRRTLLWTLLWLAAALPAAAQEESGQAAGFEVDVIAWSQMAQGVDFELGRGVTQDHAEAAKWYKRAAERGHAPAQNSVARLYETGMGVPRDEVEALMWYSLAAESGHAVAAINRDNVARRMIPDQIVEAWRRIREWRPMID